MKFEILEKKQNPLLKRDELAIAVDYEHGPSVSKAVVSEFLQKNLSAAAESVEVVQIISEVGRASGKIRARVWEGPAPKPKQKKVAGPATGA